ncbi:thioredoxin family protein [Neorhodopirellula pilleata]|uniref:Thioredoxin-1 n=1 Tax=Neorhodopirellula pilleata TaxID=2714738 RepID=A0A5C6AB51_9BACT|nr:thioredoxin domain-containing protein [Neorhodopirellula pilleata]TWT97244.1 Thioredoxin-1 [Neorhodopirellula pilleata]
MSFTNHHHHSAKTLVVLVLLAAGCGRDSSPVNDTASVNDADPIQLTDANFQNEVIDSVLPVLVDMWAPWCQPCIAMKPTIRELASDLSGRAKIAELNIDQNPFIKEKYNIDKYPMLLIFVDGIEVQRLVGTQSHKELLEALSEHLIEEELG